jgi:hypothetical protein
MSVAALAASAISYKARWTFAWRFAARAFFPLTGFLVVCLRVLSFGLVVFTIRASTVSFEF